MEDGRDLVLSMEHDGKVIQFSTLEMPPAIRMMLDTARRKIGRPMVDALKERFRDAPETPSA